MVNWYKRKSVPPETNATKTKKKNQSVTTSIHAFVVFIVRKTETNQYKNRWKSEATL